MKYLYEALSDAMLYTFVIQAVLGTYVYVFGGEIAGVPAISPILFIGMEVVLFGLSVMFKSWADRS